MAFAWVVFLCARARDDLPRVMTTRRHAALTIIIIPRNIDEYPREYARPVIDFRGYADIFTLPHRAP